MLTSVCDCTWQECVLYVSALPHTSALSIHTHSSCPYTHIAPPHHTHRFILQRRLRVCTIPLGVATEGPTVLQGAHPEVIMTCLLHRVLRVAAKEGTGEARLLLRDWLVNLTARYNWLCRASARLPQVWGLGLFCSHWCLLVFLFVVHAGGHRVMMLYTYT